MAYKNKLKGYLKFAVTSEEQGFLDTMLNRQGRYYHLSHSLNNKIDPQEMSLKEIKEYIEDNYVNSDYINKYELVNDLNIFKSLREELKIKDETDKFYTDVISFIVTIFAISSAVAVGFLSVEEKVVKLRKCNVNAFYVANFDYIFKVMKFLPIVGVIYILYCFMRVSKRSFSNKLKTINHAVFTLEAIEENLVEVPEIKKFELEVDNLEDQASEPRKYSINVNEILEDEINEGTIESKNKSIEIKINL